MLLDIRPDYLQIVQAILQKHIPEYDVWAFGSRAKWTAKEYSDLDLCVITKEPLSFTILGLLAEDFSESDLPWKVDVVDWSTTAESFQKIIEKDKVVIQKAAKRSWVMSLDSPKCSELRLNIPTDWDVLPLVEVTDFKEGPGILAKDFHEIGIPLLRLRNIESPIVKLENCNYLDPEKVAKKWKHFSLKEGDLLISTSASLGRVSVVGKEAIDSIPYTGIIRFRSSSQKLSHKYLRAFLSSSVFVNQAEQMATGSVIRHFGPSHLRQMAITLPNLNEQVSIAEIFDSLDDRITLLRETNTTLEAIAQALFKSWFVDFDPVHAKMQGTQPEGMDEQTAALFPDSFEESELGLVPAGWSIKTIDDVCDFQNGYAFKSTEMSKSTEDTYKIFKMGNIQKGGGLNRSGTKDYFEKSKSRNLDRYLLKKGDLLMCMTDMKNNVALLGHTALMDIDDEFLVNQRVGMLRSKNKEIANFPFLYLLTNSNSFIDDLRTRANSGVQVNLSTQEIKNTKFVLPSEEIHQRFNEVAEAIYEKLFILEQQQDSLADLRDTLLPRLISGQLRVGEI